MKRKRYLLCGFSDWCLNRTLAVIVSYRLRPVVVVVVGLGLPFAGIGQSKLMYQLRIPPWIKERTLVKQSLTLFLKRSLVSFCQDGQDSY